jgi:PAS domain S-box-containing protein
MSRKTAILIAAASVAVALIAIAVRLRGPGYADRVYRIGWEMSPPFQTRGDDGKPSGLAVDLVREAARRRGIRLEWVYWNKGSEFALRSKALDLWPLITVTPDRLKWFHISEPYTGAEHALLVRADSPYQRTEDLARATIGITNVQAAGWQLKHRLPETTALYRHTMRDALTDLCTGTTAALFADSYTTISSLLEDRGCRDQTLRWIAVPEVRSRLGIGATFENGGVADALRTEIGELAAEGKLADIIGRRGFMVGQHLESMQAELTAQRRATRMTAAATVFALLFVVACWQTIRVTRERDRTRRTERSLRDAEQKLRLMANHLREMVMAFDMRRKPIYANRSVETLTGYTAVDLNAASGLPWYHPEDAARMRAHWESFWTGGSVQDVEYRLMARNGSVLWMEATWGPMRDAAGKQIGVQGCERDITPRVKAEEALKESQERYLQAQKLESVGRLAGGVAHDFNNLLTVINGYGELVWEKLDPASPLRVEVEQIRLAGARAAELTRHLLAFSRKQMVQPRPLDLNRMLEEAEKMLRRMLGEDIRLRTRLEPNLGKVLADAGQIHQVLMNLAVNARDAMPMGGELVLETANVEVDESSASEHPDSQPGSYVMLSVTDTGLGMDEEVRRHIFEPFYTTKGPGKGSGLGLATVYGIVRQSHGWIGVSSEPGKGTAFQIYLPRVEVKIEDEPPAGASGAVLEGAETILVVEDQEEVRRLASRVLARYGYRVLEADGAQQAIAAAQEHKGAVDLLLMDVLLPETDGRTLAGQLRQFLPETRVLYTSGYSQNVIAHRGVLDPGVAYIGKPYTPDGLVAKVREVLDEGEDSE